LALVQLNNYSVGDPNATASYTTLDATRRGLAEVTLSNYDNDSAPVVKVGSIFANAGALYELQTSDATPTGYSGISNSTTFYLYFDESAEVFIYSSTAPTWSDVYQGWYNGLDRALFSMYKDSGGTLYQSKRKVKQLMESSFGETVKFKRYYKAIAPTRDEVFTALESWVPNVGDKIPIQGTGYAAASGNEKLSMFYMQRSTSTSMATFGLEMETGTVTVHTSTAGTSGSSLVEKDIEIMTNFDALS
jgi:hypothetical protein